MELNFREEWSGVAFYKRYQWSNIIHNKFVEAINVNEISSPKENENKMSREWEKNGLV